MSRAVIYLRLKGVGEDEDGNPCDLGLKADFGIELKNEISYDDLTKNLNKEELIKMCGLEDHVTPENLIVISEEEYNVVFADDEPCEAEAPIESNADYKDKLKRHGIEYH